MITTRFFVLVCSLFFFSVSFAQKRQLPVDTLVVTNHKTTIKGTAVSYRAETGTQPVWNEKGQPIASLFYTYYRRTNVNNGTARPLIFSFNGGPGSASVWMHVAYTGPHIENWRRYTPCLGLRQSLFHARCGRHCVHQSVNTGIRVWLKSKVKCPTESSLASMPQNTEWMTTFVSRKQR